MIDLEKEQEKLQKEGKELLNEIKLLEFLSKFGEVEIGGSFDSGVMTWRDIDLGVIADELRDENYWEIVKFLYYLKDYYHSLYIQDFRKSDNPNSLKGLYIGLKIKYLNNFWKIDVWYVNPRKENELNFNDWLKKNLTNKNKKIILEIKSLIHDNPKYRKEIFSVDIYKAVIEENVKNLEEFKGYLKKTNRSLD